jgi:hypothetical protein
VLQSSDGGPESTSEKRGACRKKSSQSAAAALPKIAEALRVFPGSKVLRVDDPEEADEIDDTPEPTRRTSFTWISAIVTVQKK